MIQHAVVLRCLVQYIVKAAHSLIDGVHHAVRPLHRPVREETGVVKRFVRKITDH